MRVRMRNPGRGTETDPEPGTRNRTWNPNREPRTLNRPVYVPVVRALQPLGVRAAVRADRRAAGAALAAAVTVDGWLWRLLWIVVAMVAARSAAMGFNRLVDARFDALNPRTAMRELPRGAMSRDARRSSFVDRRVGRVRRSPRGSSDAICFVLSPVALAIVFWYSLAKRVHDLHAAVPRSGDGGRAGRRLAGGRRPRRARAVAARRRRSAPGSAASTSSTPARISSSIARTGCDRFRCASACGARCDVARDARRRGRLPVALAAVADLGRLYLVGVGARRRAARLRAVAGQRATICRR